MAGRRLVQCEETGVGIFDPCVREHRIPSQALNTVTGAALTLGFDGMW